MMRKEFKGQTPHGGVKTLVFFQDDEGNPADESEATRAEVQELDAEGRQVFIARGDISRGVA